MSDTATKPTVKNPSFSEIDISLAEIETKMSTFNSGYRTANIFSQLFYNYSLPLIETANKSKGQIKDDALLDMKQKDDET
jgi:hypothetical protein